MPLIGALAAGNCVVLKVSRQAPHISEVMERIISHFPRELVTMINGDHTVSEYLLDQKFDYIFFTGSTSVGKYVMQKAAANLTPVSLELGGKNPCVVTADAKLEFAARRIAWGKFINGGQTCICPDYVLIDSRVKDRFLELISLEIKKFFGDDPESSDSFSRIISQANIDRLACLVSSGKIIAGGNYERESCYFAPTVISDILPGDLIMKDEVFGPILPVIEYSDFEEVYPIIDLYPKPLATYIFSGSRKQINEFIARTRAGTAGINETVMQIASPYLPYGGVGASGMGRYHGKKSFDTFSNMRSVLEKSNLFDIPVRYAPYSLLKVNIIKLLMR
jgi:acyl-CoA reductase-like NAD-dependent aldehyde dehydrogenase